MEFSPTRPRRTREKELINTKNTGSFFTQPAVLVLWAILCLIIGISLLHSGFMSRGILSKKAEAQKKLEEEEKKSLEMSQELEKATSDFAKEKIIREELRMQKPGETILQLPSPGP